MGGMTVEEDGSSLDMKSIHSALKVNAFFLPLRIIAVGSHFLIEFTDFFLNVSRRTIKQRRKPEFLEIHRTCITENKVLVLRANLWAMSRSGLQQGDMHGKIESLCTKGIVLWAIRIIIETMSSLSQKESLCTKGVS